MKSLSKVCVFVVFIIFTTSSGAETASVCPEIPYSIRVKDVGGQAKATVSLLKGAANNLGNINAVGGAAFVRAAYAGMAQQVIGDVIQNYKCRIEEQIDISAPTDEKDAIKEQLGDAIDKINLEAGNLAVLFASGSLSEIRDASNVIYSTKKTDGYQGIDGIYVSKALDDIARKKNDIFLVKKLYEGWLGITVQAGVTVGACGGLLMAALEGDNGPLQRTAADTDLILRQYLNITDPKGPRHSLSLLFKDMCTVRSVPAPTEELKSRFKDCETNTPTKEIKKDILPGILAGAQKSQDASASGETPLTPVGNSSKATTGIK